MDEISAFVLAGGKSFRMGTDKALLKTGETTLLQRALSLAQPVAQNVLIVGDPAKFAGLGNIIEDTYRGCGPLAGIHAALSYSPTDRNLLVAVDLPFVTEEFLKFLIAIALQCTAVVTVPRCAGRLQPLCAIYRKSFAEAAEQALQQGRYKIDPLFEQVPTRMVEETELAAAGFSAAIFENVNTPAEWRDAQSRLSKRL